MPTRGRHWLVVVLSLLCAARAWAQPAADVVQLVDAKAPLAGWKFDNGQEFKGATGSLTVDPGAGPQGRDCLKLVGDFTNGGQYVQLGRKLETDQQLDVRELTFWVRNPDADRFTLRLTDVTGQAHQLSI